jgi:hypothetical protein
MEGLGAFLVCLGVWIAALMFAFRRKAPITPHPQHPRR